MSKPLISVCIPVYNGEKFIGDAIESILNQTYKNFELIILDNASTDNTKEIIEKYNDKRIRNYRNSVTIEGIENWNKSMSYAKGEYIKILCADDILKRNALEEFIKIINDKSVEFAFCNYDIIDENNIIVKQNNCDTKSKLYKSGKETIKQIIIHDIKLPICPSFFIFSRKILDYAKEFIKVYGSSYNLDLEFVTRIVNKFSFYYIGESLAYSRIHTMQWTNKATSGAEKTKQMIGFSEYIIMKYNIKLGLIENYKCNFPKFISGISDIVLKHKSINKEEINYFKNNFNIIYYMYIPIYAMLNYIPKKIKFKIVRSKCNKIEVR